MAAVGWNFPLLDGGREGGINDGGIEHFRANHLASLAREICQNSLDAKDQFKSVPVKVLFNLEHLSQDQFPGCEDFRRTLEACAEYWENRNDEKALRFFSGALNIVREVKIPFLRISDFNTTGLLGAEREGSDWHNLIKAVGVSEKGTGKGGSFGIGKAAPFACSGIRTVFYSTLDKEGVRAFQGVARLVTHRSPLRKGQATQDTGYFGKKRRQ